MPNDFRAVEAYLSHINNNSNSNTMLTYDSGFDFQADQKVPQLTTSYPLMDDDMMFCTVKTEPDMLFQMDPFCMSGDVKLAPVAPMNCTPVELHDQQLTGEQSPTQLLDLDHVNNQDETFYPAPIPSVHIKQELPDVPSGCTEYGYDPLPKQQDCYLYSELESVSNLLLRDIKSACATLGISLNPSEWSAEQTFSWVKWTLELDGRNSSEACMFTISGHTLSQLTEADFRIRSVENGNYLYYQLEAWKNARLYNQTSAASIEQNFTPENTFMSFQDTFIQQPAPSVSPAPSLSPAPSMSSLDSISSNSNSSMGFNSTANTSTQFSDYFPTTVKTEKVLPKTTRHGSEHKQTIHLWQFLKELLRTHSNEKCIKWLDHEKGIFKIEDSRRVATLWGMRKNRPKMDYDKLSRSIRQYYKKGIIKKTVNSKRLVYQFCQPYLS